MEGVEAWCCMMRGGVVVVEVGREHQRDYSPTKVVSDDDRSVMW